MFNLCQYTQSLRVTLESKFYTHTLYLSLSPPSLSFSPLTNAVCPYRCGVRGGYMELLGFESVIDEINKLFRTKLCPNTMGQVVTDAMVYPPDKTGPSYHLYKEVEDTTYSL